MRFIHYVTLALAWLLGCGHAARSQNINGVYYIDNGQVRLGVDLNRGGAITFLARSGQPNAVNNHDNGRQIQPDYYQDPIPYHPPGTELNEAWRQNGYNTTYAGDAFGTNCPTIAHSFDGSTLYIQMRPLLWPLRKYHAEAICEAWYTVVDNRVHVRYRFTNQRTDGVSSFRKGMSAPVVYLNNAYNRCFTYRGGAPFTSAPVDQAPMPPGQDNGFSATEKWAMLVDGSGQGVGVYSETPGLYWYSRRYHPDEGGGEFDGATCVLNPVTTVDIAPSSVLNHEADLIVGTVDDIRRYAYSRNGQAPPPPPPAKPSPPPPSPAPPAPGPPPGDASYEGFQDVANCDYVLGWVWDRKRPNTPLTVELVDGNVVVATQLAANFRQDLRDAGKGNGEHAYNFPLPESLKNGQPHALSVRVQATQFVLTGSPKTVTCAGSGTPPPPPPAPNPPAPPAPGPPPADASYEGFTEITNCHQIAGWVWDSKRPNTPLTVELVENGRVLQTQLANGERPDLVGHGKGDGRKAFRFWDYDNLRDHQPHTVSVRVAGTNFVLTGSPAQFACGKLSRMAAPAEAGAPLVFSVFPNPATDVVTVRFHALRAQTVTLTLTNVVGEVVWRQHVAAPAGNTELKLPLDGPAGAYMLSAEIDQQPVGQKILKL